MERPPVVPVNVIGKLMICDPEQFPTTVSFEERWIVAVGVHPKKVAGLTSEREVDFLRLIEFT